MNAVRCAALLGALALAGCMSEQQSKAIATDEAKQHCEAEGKQFVLKSTEVKDAPNMFAGKSVIVAGDCLSPGDPGYVEPPRKP